jgi:ABC-type Zn uptake system ZnuABC Zn-binding protein ZnuA
MGSKIAPSKAISLAEGAFNAWYTGNGIAAKTAAYDAGGAWTVKVKNDGTEDFVTSDQEKNVSDTWKGKGAMHGFDRRASITSGVESKIDLKFAYPGISESSFNYHVWFKPDPALALAEAAREKEAAAAKKSAAEFKAKQAKEAELKAAADKVKADAAKLEAARLKKVSEGAAAAWNKLGKDGQKKTGKKEDDWKKEWMKDNDKKFK